MTKQQALSGRGKNRLNSSEEEVLARIEGFRRRRPRLTDEFITMAHGAGGKASAALVDAVFVEAFGEPAAGELTDGATLAVGAGRLAFSTDSYVVSPIRFPGGSIGDLAVNGTVNDLSVSGARPAWLSAAFVLEEGLSVATLRQVVADMAAAARQAGVTIVTGDTKVVPRGAADKLYITTSGIGAIPDGRTLGAAQVRPGDRLVLSGPLGDHGMAVMLARGNLALEADIRSDSAPVNGLVEALYAVTDEIRWMRDATRGGLGTVANEFAQVSGLGVLLKEEALPVRPTVRSACDMLGIDPLYVANEGCFAAIVAAEAVGPAVAALQAAGAREAAVVGEVRDDLPGLVAVRNGFGGTRLVDMLVGDALPRIC
ncbi:hydrogenase expression/formation protein HypE [Gordonia sp. PP30]|uniref:hydrogenase expression/formation protein HypE n=1 Tax=Gordonia sp. PP30 TaxID=2935861 RepID=UPI0020002EE0|nr:hydrogenase expression/formation protein HypE [Gordonia sp. PP30]UQE76477.1 hydrogenase expression/formation protein HypE [Gordonia sp. PP30]